MLWYTPRHSPWPEEESYATCYHRASHAACCMLHGHSTGTMMFSHPLALSKALNTQAPYNEAEVRLRLYEVKQTWKFLLRPHGIKYCYVPCSGARIQPPLTAWVIFSLIFGPEIGPEPRLARRRRKRAAWNPGYVLHMVAPRQIFWASSVWFGF